VKILHYARRIVLEEGGVVRAVLDMAAAMARAGHGVTLATPEPTDIPEGWGRGEPGTPGVLRLDPVRSRLDLLSKPALDALRGAVAEADVVHLHGPWVTSNLQAAAACRRAGTPYVISTHGVFNEWALAHRGLKKKLYLSLFGRRLLEGAGSVHCTAGAELDHAASAFPRGRGAVVPLIFDASPYRELRGPGEAEARFPELAGGEPVVLFLGRVAPIKRVELLVEAFAAAAREAPGARLVIAGVFEDEAYQRRLASLAGDLGVGGRTTFAGHVGGTLKTSLYERASVMALTSYQENFGIVLYEALACGTPVVATRGVNSWKLLSECPAAAIVDPPSAEGVAAALLGWIRSGSGSGFGSGSGSGSGSEGARSWVLERMSEPALCAAYEGMYRGAGANTAG